MKRRNVLKVISSVLVFSITPVLPALAQSVPEFGLATLPQEHVHRVKMDGVEIIALHDGATRLPLHDRYVAVSYTHLDVYKRQRPARSRTR